MPERPQVPAVRFPFIEDGGSDPSPEGAEPLFIFMEDDGNGGGAPPQFSAWPSIYVIGGVVTPVSYLQQVFNPTLLGLFTAAGYAYEPGFLVNDSGVATVQGFMTSLTGASPPPIGTKEHIPSMTKDGLTNLDRYLVRFNP